MGSFLSTYQVAQDTWRLTYLPQEGSQPEGVYSDGVLVPAGDWTAFASPFGVNDNSALGLVLQLENGEFLEFLTHNRPPPNTPEALFVQFPDQQITLRVEQRDGVLTFSHSIDQFNWIEEASFEPLEPVSEVGVVLRYDFQDTPAGGILYAPRLLEGLWEIGFEEVWLPPWPDAFPGPHIPGVTPTVTSTSEPPVHAIIGAQFGDLEFDVGKSVRWVSWFTDNVFVLDVALGDPRYWIVNWTETFPDAEHRVTGINFFVRPAEFRKEQWRLYKATFGEPDPAEWFLFVDAHEGISFDNRTLPNDYAFAPFQSFLWREIQRAQNAGQSSVVIPYYVFLRSDHVTNVTYTTPADLTGVDSVVQALSVPYYLPYQGLRRLWNAAALQNPSFDWSQLDTPATPSTGVLVQILSYGYAHWNLQDIEPPATTVPPLTAANDDGWRMRNQISRIRPVPGLPYEISGANHSALAYDSYDIDLYQAYYTLTPSTGEDMTSLWWADFDFPESASLPPLPMYIVSASGSFPVVDTSGDPVSGQTMRDLWVPTASLDAGISAGSAPLTWNTDHWVMPKTWPPAESAGLPGPWAPDDFNNPDPLDPVTGNPLPPPVIANPALLGLLTPLYDTSLRLNMRDGVWYESGVSGNIPLIWDGTKWTTNYDPALWAEQGVGSYDPSAVP